MPRALSTREPDLLECVKKVKIHSKICVVPRKCWIMCKYERLPGVIRNVVHLNLLNPDACDLETPMVLAPAWLEPQLPTARVGALSFVDQI